MLSCNRRQPLKVGILKQLTSSSSVFSRVCIALSVVFCVVFRRALFFFSFGHCVVFSAFDYPFGIIQLFFLTKTKICRRMTCVSKTTLSETLISFLTLQSNFSLQLLCTFHFLVKLHIYLYNCNFHKFTP